MKKFAIAALTAVVATVSLANVAEARRRHNDEDWGRHHNDRWDHHRRHDFFDVDFRDRCGTTKIIKFDEDGNKFVKIIKSCR